MAAERWDEQVGSVADEAGRLLESLRRAAEAESQRHEPGDPVAAEGEAPPGGHDPFCQWCPLCRGAAVVRSLSPETLARLADLAGVAAAVLADLASARRSASDEPGTDDTADAPTPSARSVATSPILVRDADDPEEAPRG